MYTIYRPKGLRTVYTDPTRLKHILWPEKSRYLGMRCINVLSQNSKKIIYNYILLSQHKQGLCAICTVTVMHFPLLTLSIN